MKGLGFDSFQGLMEHHLRVKACEELFGARPSIVGLDVRHLKFFGALCCEDR